MKDRSDDGVLIVEVAGVIDMLTAPALTDHLRAALAAPPAAIIIDLTHVTFLGAAGLEVLVSTRDAAGEATPVVVVADGPITRRPITLTGVDHLVALHISVPQALTAFRATERYGSAGVAE